jgi:predicted RNA-binding Zn ribbon-like protein
MTAVSFTFVSGHVALDLVGTVGHRAGPDRYDLLDEPAALGRWLVAAGVLDSTPPAGSEDLVRAVELREAIYRVARAYLAGAEPDTADREVINQAAAPPPVTVRLRADGRIEHSGDATSARSTLARSAVELFGAGGMRHQLKACRGEGCTRLFLDFSRRGSRQWCEMAGCGNRAKAAAFRRRHAAR